MGTLYLLLTLAFAAALVFLLLRPGLARATVVWGLAALLPLLAALAGSLGVQARAARTLAGYAPAPVTLLLVRDGQGRAVTLSAQQAACVERATRLQARVWLATPQGRFRLDGRTRVEGNLPPTAAVEALTLRGELSCPDLRALREGEE